MSVPYVKMSDPTPPVRILSRKNRHCGKPRASTLLDHMCMDTGASSRELLVFTISQNRDKALHLLKNSVLTANHLGLRNRQVRFGRLSEQSAKDQLALGGYLGITVQQYMYVKHGERLSYPELPCVEVYSNNGHVWYYPMELLDCVPTGVY